MTVSFAIRAATQADNNFIQSSIRKTYHVFKPEYDFTSGNNSILIACDSEDSTVSYSFIIVNQDNELVFGFTKPIFRRFGLFKALLEYFPDRPSHYITQPSHQAQKALKALKLTYLVRIPL